MPICSIDGCDRKVIARGFCSRHYDAWRYHGDAEKRIRAENGEPSAWLKAHASYEGDDCLIWPFGKSNGRGVICFQEQMNIASRVMCELVHGPAPTLEHEAAHSCGKGHLACVSPGHVRWATSQENRDDKIAHGTVLKGEQVFSAKLTEEKVRAIIARLNRGESGDVLAEHYGVHKATISDIRTGRTWKHVRGVG